jgi:hypothetical protein
MPSSSSSASHFFQQRNQFKGISLIESMRHAKPYPLQRSCRLAQHVLMSTSAIHRMANWGRRQCMLKSKAQPVCSSCLQVPVQVSNSVLDRPPFTEGLCLGRRVSVVGSMGRGCRLYRLNKQQNMLEVVSVTINRRLSHSSVTDKDDHHPVPLRLPSVPYGSKRRR